MAETVQPSKSMTDEQFMEHLNKRHMPVAGLVRTPDRMGPGVIELVRAYHKRVHRQGWEDSPHRELTHGHGVGGEPV